MIQRFRRTGPDRMQPRQFEALCRSVFGTYWRRPAARALGRDPKMMRRYAAGDTVVPVDVARKLLAITDIGPIAEAVKQVVIAASMRDAHARHQGRVSIQEKAHFLAVEIAAQLRRASLVQEFESKGEVH